ncbi:MAG: hypothetical protein FJ161_00140 [Gammaproteobacteria bacterium]|nr:hypothetical protein [Gammaproteobacteria bacterium]
MAHILSDIRDIITIAIESPNHTFSAEQIEKLKELIVDLSKTKLDNNVIEAGIGVFSKLVFIYDGLEFLYMENFPFIEHRESILQKGFIDLYIHAGTLRFYSLFYYHLVKYPSLFAIELLSAFDDFSDMEWVMRLTEDVYTSILEKKSHNPLMLGQENIQDSDRDSIITSIQHMRQNRDNIKTDWQVDNDKISKNKIVQRYNSKIKNHARIAQEYMDNIQKIRELECEKNHILSKLRVLQPHYSHTNLDHIGHRTQISEYRRLNKNLQEILESLKKYRDIQTKLSLDQEHYIAQLELHESNYRSIMEQYKCVLEESALLAATHQLNRVQQVLTFSEQPDIAERCNHIQSSLSFSSAEEVTSPLHILKPEECLEEIAELSHAVEASSPRKIKILRFNPREDIQEFYSTHHCF